MASTMSRRTIDEMQIEVRFLDGRRMWPARLEQVGIGDDEQPLFEAVPVEDGVWSFVRADSFHRGIWRAQRRITT